MEVESTPNQEPSNRSEPQPQSSHLQNGVGHAGNNNINSTSNHPNQPPPAAKQHTGTNGENGANNAQHAPVESAPRSGEPKTGEPQPPQIGASTSQQQQQQPVAAAPVISKKQKAINKANERYRLFNKPLEALLLTSELLNYDDLVSVACVSKFFHSSMKKTSIWRRVVINHEKTLRGHVGRITALASLENHVFSASLDGKIKAWDTKNWGCIITRDSTATPGTQHPRLIASRQPLLNAQSPHANLQPHADEDLPEFPLAVTALATANQLIMSGTEDGTLKMWWVAQKKDEFVTYAASVHRHRFPVSAICIADDAFFYSGCHGGWLIRGATRIVNDKTPHVMDGDSKLIGQAITCICVTRTGFVFVGCTSGAIYVFAATSGLPKRQIIQAHKDRVTALTAINIDQRKTFVYSASWDCTITCWNAADGTMVKTINVDPVGICWSLTLRRDPIGIKTLVAGCRDNDIMILSVDLKILSSMEECKWAYKNDQHKGWVRTVLALADGRIVTGSDDWTCKVWNYRGYLRGSSKDFHGLDPGRLSEEDMDIILYDMRRRNPAAAATYTKVQLQEAKLKFDLNREAKYLLLSASEREMERERERLSVENWTQVRLEHRERLKKDLASTNGGTAPKAEEEMDGWD